LEKIPTPMPADLAMRMNRFSFRKCSCAAGSSKLLYQPTVKQNPIELVPHRARLSM